jgi:hypothetical protein
MPLQGTIQEFGALETFQLIALQQKTGTLEISTRSSTHSFIFEGGLLQAAHVSPLHAEDPLPRLLVEAGFLSEEDLRAWLSFPGNQPVNPLDLLPKLSSMDEEQLLEAYDLYVQTVMDEVLSWRHGRFLFHSGRIETPSKVIGPWKVEGFLMESMRRIDELTDLQATDLPPGLIPRPRPHAASNRTQDRFARAVLRHIDGRLSLQEIVAASALPAYDLHRAIRELRDSQQIELTEWIPSGPWMNSMWRRGARWKWIPLSIGGLAVLAAVTAGTQMLLETCAPSWHQNSTFSFLSPVARAARSDYSTAQLMEAFRVRRGHYPRSHAELVEDGLISRRAARKLALDGSRWTLDAGGQTYAWGVTATTRDSDADGLPDDADGLPDDSPRGLSGGRPGEPLRETDGRTDSGPLSQSGSVADRVPHTAEPDGAAADPPND